MARRPKNSGFLVRREILALGGLSLLGAVPETAAAQMDVDPPKPFSVSTKDRLRAVQFRSALTRVEWVSEVMANYRPPEMAPATEKEDLAAFASYYNTAWRTIEQNLGWAKEITDKTLKEISDFARQSVERFTNLNAEDRSALLKSLEAAGGAGKVAQERLTKLPEVGISANEAIRKQQEKSGVPKVEDAKLLTELMCSLLGSQLSAAAIGGQWQSQVLLLLKLRWLGCL